MSQHTVVLLLGSNLGDQKKNLEAGLHHLEETGIEILTKSEFLYSEPVEFASINIFCNIALLIKTQFSPLKLLKSVKAIEQKMGRLTDTKRGSGYTDRIIDIDIVRFNNIIFESAELEIPHRKHLYEREFSASILKNLMNNNTI